MPCWCGVFLADRRKFVSLLKTVNTVEYTVFCFQRMLLQIKIETAVYPFSTRQKGSFLMRSACRSVHSISSARRAHIAAATRHRYVDPEPKDTVWISVLSVSAEQHGIRVREGCTSTRAAALCSSRLVCV